MRRTRRRSSRATRGTDDRSPHQPDPPAARRAGPQARGSRERRRRDAAPRPRARDRELRQRQHRRRGDARPHAAGAARGSRGQGRLAQPADGRGAAPRARRADGGRGVRQGAALVRRHRGGRRRPVRHGRLAARSRSSRRSCGPPRRAGATSPTSRSASTPAPRTACSTCCGARCASRAASRCATRCRRPRWATTSWRRWSATSRWASSPPPPPKRSARSPPRASTRGVPLLLVAPKALPNPILLDALQEAAEKLARRWLERGGAVAGLAIGTHADYGLGLARRDEVLIGELGERLGREVPVLGPQLPPALAKAVVGEADALFGLRLHALIFAVSTGVPCLGVGWEERTTRVPRRARAVGDQHPAAGRGPDRLGRRHAARAVVRPPAPAQLLITARRRGRGAASAATGGRLRRRSPRGRRGCRAGTASATGSRSRCTSPARRAAPRAR